MRDISDAPEGLAQALRGWDERTTRREFLQRSGLFVFSLNGVMAGVAPLGGRPHSADQVAQGPYPDVDFRQLFEANGLVLVRVRFQKHERPLDYYLDLAACEGDERRRAEALSPGGPDSYTIETAWYLLAKPGPRV